MKLTVNQPKVKVIPKPFYVRMIDYIKSIISHFTNEDKIVASFAGIWGLLKSFTFIDVVSKWQLIVSGTESLIWLFLTIQVGMWGKKFFSWSQPKISKFATLISVKVIHIKTKCFKNGKRNSNEKAA